MAELVLRCGARVLVDDDVWAWAHAHRWYLKAGYPCRYVRCSGYGRKDYREVYLHREIMGEPEGMDVHHKDSDPLHCRRENLEVLPRGEHRRRHRHGARRAGEIAPPRAGCGFKGVTWHQGLGKWKAALARKGRLQHLGYYDTPEAAAWAYDCAVWLYRAGRGFLNFGTDKPAPEPDPPPSACEAD